jgi:predicted PhzF superfamily epimerase YddE/YHI9
VIELKVVDAFTSEPFSGNPAAVTFLNRFPPDDWMAKVAREMNLSETAFVVPRPDGDHDLRWFTPAAEVDLCGHATLASAHVLGGSARFHTRSGPLECRPGESGRIEMDFPADPPEPAPVEAALDLPGAEVLAWARGRFDILIEVADAGWLRAYQPDVAAIAGLGSRGLILTAAGDQEGIDFVSRFFGPAVGVVEDPVTGSAHCTLAVYWAARTGRSAMTGYQASARGGTVNVRLAGDRVVLGGSAVTVSEVRMAVDPPA